MKKRIILLLSLLALMAVLFAISINAAEPVETWDISATENDSVTAYLYEDTENEGYYTLTISGTGNMRDWSYSNIPWRSSYKTVIKTVLIGKGVTNVGEHSFYNCTGLAYIEISDSVTTINHSAFEGCKKLTCITVDENNPKYSSISGNLFTKDGRVLIRYAIGKTNATFNIPESVITIGESAFEDSGSLASIVFSKGVTTIEEAAFRNCKVLTYVKILEGVTSIGKYAFYDCTNLTSIVIPDGVTEIKTGTFEFCTNLVEINIPEGVTKIGVGSFEYCKNLTDIVLPSSLTDIGVSAFSHCEKLKKIVIPISVTNIGFSVFNYCNSLVDISVQNGNTIYTSIDGNLYLKNGRTLVQYAVGKSESIFVIPQNVNTIESFAFASSQSLTRVIIHRQVSNIEYFAFSYCSNLTIYCEIENQPSKWTSHWNNSNCPVVWGYFDANSCLSSIFTFKGYSFGWTGSMAVGFEIDYEAIARYEEKTGETLDFGVVFAGFDALGGNMPLDANGNAHADAVKFSTKDYGYIQYDFVITDMTEEYFDISFVISAYIYNGVAVKYVQENGLCDSVMGATYNQAKGV